MSSEKNDGKQIDNICQEIQLDHEQSKLMIVNNFSKTSPFINKSKMSVKMITICIGYLEIRLIFLSSILLQGKEQDTTLTMKLSKSDRQ